MKKLTKIIATATAALLALGFAGCDKNSGGPKTPVTYPAFINSADSSGDPNEQVSEKYVVNVLSEGGMKLDGVQVALKRGDTVIKRGISKKGKIEFATDLGSYQLEVDESSLPAGYYLNKDATYSTNPSKRDEVNIKIPSKLLPSTASMKSYATGNIMRDFTITDVDGKSHTLSNLLSTKKAVVLNFFFTTCGPCRSEFPYLQTAYANRVSGDIEVLGICSSTAVGDTTQTIAALKMELGLTFPLSLDTIGLCNSFGVSGYPTTVIIDRYGMIAFRDSGGRPSTSFWTQKFNQFTAANYVQDITASEGGGPNNSSAELVKPTEQMPASAVLEQAALDNAKATFKAYDDEYSWPWKAGSDADGGYIYSSNTGIDNSYAIVQADIPMEADDLLSFEYKISSEANSDYLYILLDGVLMNTGYSGGDDKWHTVNLYVSDRTKTVTLSFTYQKDAGDSSGDDVAMIRNINVSNVDQLKDDAPLDVMRACASGTTAENRYGHYVDAVYNPDDGFYHKDAEDGPIIYMTINQLTPWSELHTGSTSQAADGSTYQNTIFKITENNYLKQISVSEQETEIEVKMGGKDVTEAYIVYVTIMSYMPAPYYLIPVTEKLKEWADALVAAYEKGAEHEDEWLEFCYYYDHYGVGHDDKDKGDRETCKVDVDYTRGLTVYNAYTAYEKSELANMSADEKAALDPNTYNAATGRNKATINFPLKLTHNGTYYRFKATKSGVYQIRSYTKGCSPTTESTSDNTDSYVTADPALTVYDGKGNYMRTVEGVYDHDSFKSEVYEGFNTYLTMDAGEEVLLYLETTASTKSYYDFEITYHEGPLNKMLVCSTGNGFWTYDELENGSIIFKYVGIDVMYDDITDCYYAVKNGQPDLDQPVYIDMLYSSFFMCNIPKYYFATLQYMIQDNAFRGLSMPGKVPQTIMNRLLGESTANKNEDDPLYGLVPATREIVDVLNRYIEVNVDGGKGEGNGWLAFAVYNAKIG